MKTIVLAYNDTDAANRALERAAELAGFYRAKLVVTSIVPVLVGTELPTEPQEELRRADAMLRERGIEAELVEAVGDIADAIVEVADTGYGIPPERLNTIFEDFVTTKRRGLGLGLAISKKIVEQLDGTIGVSSEVGVGTTFTMRFPLTKARPSRLAAV